MVKREVTIDDTVAEYVAKIAFLPTAAQPSERNIL